MRDICEAVKLKSTSSVHSHLETLEKNGYIRRDPTKPRAIEILDDEFNLARREMVNVPIVGTVTAGEPILAVENITGYFLYLPRWFRMLNYSCCCPWRKHDQCWYPWRWPCHRPTAVLCRQRRYGRCSGWWFCNCEDFYKEEDHYRLQPQNDAFSPIITRQCEILGKVIGLVRMNM